MDLAGELDVVCTFTSAKTTVSGTLSSNAQEVSAVGSLTRDRYRGLGGDHQDFTATLAEGTDSFSFVGLFRLMGPGPAHDVHIYSSYHFTQDLAGEYVVTINRPRAECK